MTNVRTPKEKIEMTEQLREKIARWMEAASADPHNDTEIESVGSDAGLTTLTETERQVYDALAFDYGGGMPWSQFVKRAKALLAGQAEVAWKSKAFSGLNNSSPVDGYALMRAGYSKNGQANG
jgi:hypothetical protein